MKLREFLCCKENKSRKSVDIGSSGYFNSSISNAGDCNYFKILEMTSENFQDIFNRYKYVLVQFNDRK